MVSTVLTGAPGEIPDGPRCLPPGIHIVEPLLVLERVHARPKARVRVGEESVLLDQATEGRLDELITRLHDVKDVPPEDEEPPIDPEAGLTGRLEAANPATVVGLDHVKGRCWRHAEKARRRVTAPEIIEVRRQMEVGQAVRVVRHEEIVTVVEIWLHGLEPLAEIRTEAGVDERDPPVIDVAPKELDIFPALREDKIVRHALVILQEVVLDQVAPVAKAEDEIVTSVMRVVLHQVPDDGAVADVDHRLRDGLGVFSEPRAQPAAEEDDLHEPPPIAFRSPASSSFHHSMVWPSPCSRSYLGRHATSLNKREVSAISSGTSFGRLGRAPN